jgi:outer membrane protein OmpA-like peptidoglycan-associated protein
MAHNSKFFGIILTVVIFFTQSLHAQNRDSLWLKTGRWSAWGARFQTQTFGISENNLDTCNCEGDKRSLTQRGNAGLLVSYYTSVNTRLAYSVDFGFSYGRVSTTRRSTLVASSKLFTSLRGDVYYHVGKERQMITPYLHTGLHAQIGSLYASLPLGAGMRWVMKKSPVFINTQLDYGFGLTSNLRNNLMTSLGVYVNLGSDKKLKLNFWPIRHKEPKVPCDADTDMDGIPDLLDACPLLKGSKENLGCPTCDTDGDGIVDDKDKCPSIPGSMTNQGCPIQDSDGDGVVDEKDNCPDQPGPINNLGCPLVDRDADGVADLIDRCPDAAGPSINNGCPVVSDDSKKVDESKSIVSSHSNQVEFKTVAVDSVQYIIYFDFDKYLLKSVSITTLNDVVKHMQQHPDVKVSLKGHTDLEGNIGYNKNLSKKRVQNARFYLMGKGIAVERIVADYFGKGRPIVETIEKSQGWKNRRVEIFIVK